jgi:RNA polymerase sigma-70 factor (ECF subfamily)
MLSEKDLIKGCKDYNIKAQQELYERFARKMMGVCYYYTGSTEDAKDLLHEGFIKVFAKFGQYKEEGSLEGWIRRVMVNTAINFLNKKKSGLEIKKGLDNLEENYLNDTNDEEEKHRIDFTQEEILSIINTLPDAYRLVFNMSCIENYSHKEIAELMNITEGNSRVKLKKARDLIRAKLSILQNAKEGK